MFFGVSTLQTFHVLVSLAGIATGLIVLAGMLTSRHKDRLIPVFLGTTLVTTLTGFLFPLNGFTPALGVGIISTVVMIVALLALYWRHLAGRWRGIFVLTAVTALYLNTFVLVVQVFQKVPTLNALAPTGSEPPFAVVQSVVLLGFITAGWLAFRRYLPATT